MKLNLLLFLTCLFYSYGYAQIGFQDHIIVDNSSVINGEIFNFSADLDGDGDMDLVTSYLGADKVVWYENTDGLGNFGPRQFITSYSEGAPIIFASDIDGDGDMDVLSGSLSDGKIAWAENTNGQGDFGNEQIITESFNDNAISMYVADLDGDGDMDVLYAYISDEIAWCENTNGQGDFSAPQIISTTAEFPSSVHASDIDGDGDMDVLSSSRWDNAIAWYENTDGQGTFGAAQFVTTIAFDATYVYTSDIDGDGDMDVLSASESKIAWYENLDGLGNFGIQQAINTDAYAASGVMGTDMDGDGDMDVLFSDENGNGFDGRAAWHENTDGLGTFGPEQLIANDPNGVVSIFAADLNGDGRIDVLPGAGWASNMVWYENLSLITNQINGLIRLDVNANGCDIDDTLIPNFKVVTTNGVQSLATFTLSNGFYQLFPQEGNFTTTITANLPNYFSANPGSYSSNFTDVGNTEVADFCLESNQTVNDVNIAVFPTSEARPGFEAFYQIVFKNAGSTQLSENIVMTFDDARLDFLMASETVTVQTTNTLTFDYSDLNPYETKTIALQFYVFEPPTVEIGDALHFSATVNPIAGDYTVEDNAFDLVQTVVGSFDPNDITVLEGKEVSLEDADNYLHYIIRFQNTGTAHAFNVKVTNLLDANLDWNTIELESSSHSNRVEIKDGNEVAFIFDGIYLPDSTNNEPESHGFIAYKIKPNGDIALGDIIYNEAAIFFDFNPAVETNTVSTEIVAPSSLRKSKALQFSVYPIPTSGFLGVKSKSNIAQIEIYNSMGQLVLTNANEARIDLSALNHGLYFCIVKDENGDEGIQKLVKE